MPSNYTMKLPLKLNQNQSIMKPQLQQPVLPLRPREQVIPKKSINNKNNVLRMAINAQISSVYNYNNSGGGGCGCGR